ncbi:hypothetical protein [Eubacterium aggregans]|uniref:hypothetical protein n=1 Tax=Eubacterium aggregans TaxID=81409 RepID=UPI003F3FBF8C
MRLKKTSGVDIKQKIKDLIQPQTGRVTIKEALNSTNFDNYMYPSRYNDDREMTQYFAFEFIEDHEIKESINWNVKNECIQADGVIYAIVPTSEESIHYLNDLILETSKNMDRNIFILPKYFREIESVIREYNAVVTLKKQFIRQSRFI